MPMQWVPPEIFLTYNGVTIYHTYKDQDINARMHYWFSLSEDEDDDAAFDIRDLISKSRGTLHSKNVDLECRESVFRCLIDEGILTAGSGVYGEGVPDEGGVK